MNQIIHEFFVEAILEVRKKGVRVVIITDRPGKTSFDARIIDNFKTLHGNGIELYLQPENTGLMHNKFAVIDGRKLIFGSMNWTHGGAVRNYESVMISQRPFEIQVFKNHFNRLSGHMKRYNPAQFCPRDDSD